MKFSTFAITFAAPVFGVVALAATSGCMSTADANVHKVAGGATPIFHHLDANGDGKVTYAEFDAGFADTIFSTYNRNVDHHARRSRSARSSRHRVRSISRRMAILPVALGCARRADKSVLSSA